MNEVGGGLLLSIVILGALFYVIDRMRPQTPTWKGGGGTNEAWLKRPARRQPAGAAHSRGAGVFGAVGAGMLLVYAAKYGLGGIATGPQMALAGLALLCVAVLVVLALQRDGRSGGRG